MAKLLQARLGIALFTGLLAATPTWAVKSFTPQGQVISGPNSMSAYGALGTVDSVDLSNANVPVRDRAPAQAAVAVPEPAGWLMMLLGFGLLGAMARRGTPHPLRDELI